MIVSKKSKYAMRAVFELAKNYEGGGPVKISDIAARQAIPPRFLEVILCQLKQGGFVDSKRGSEGGYYLTHEPKTLAPGKILRYFQGLDEPVDCIGDNPKEKCPLRENCVFMPLWDELKSAISNVFDSTSFQDLVDRELENRNNKCLDYVI